MLQRDPSLANKLYPFNKRMGIEDFLRRDKEVTKDQNENALEDLPKKDQKPVTAHVKITDNFFQKPLDQDDQRIQMSLKFLEQNNYNVDFKKIRRAFEGSLWRKELKEQMNMKRFVQEKLNKNMMEQRWTLNLMRKRGKNPKTLMLIN